MLQTQKIEPGTFSLLKRLLGMHVLKDFYLVGGTALALRFGHRISDDLDIFSHLPFEHENILADLDS